MNRTYAVALTDTRWAPRPLAAVEKSSILRGEKEFRY
jgi:hypothetical protein